jgi:hypothetical protein
VTAVGKLYKRTGIAGEFSVKTSAGSGGGQAEALRKSAERLMAPYAQAEDFCFRGVRG